MGAEEDVAVALEGLVEDRAARLRSRADVVLELEVVREDGVVGLGGLDVLGPGPQGRGPAGEHCRQQQRKPEPRARHGPPVSPLPAGGAT